MRLGVITPWDYKCGISVYAEHLVNHLRKLGHEVLVFANHGDERDRRFEADEEGVERCWEHDEAFPQLLSCVEAAGPLDAVNIQHELYYCSKPHLWNQLLHGLHRLGHRVVVTFHSVPIAANPITDHPEVDAVVATNPLAAEALTARGHAQEHVWFVEHGSLPPCPLPVGEPGRRLVTFGFLTGTKGYSDLIRVLARLAPDYADVHLTILGSIAWRLQTYQFEYYYCELRKEILALGLSDRVTLWTGFPTEAVLQEAISGHDLSVLYYTPTFPSFASSACLRTAFSAARPVVASECHHFDVPPHAEGAVARAGTPKQLEQTIRRLFDDAEHYREMAHRAHDAALRRPHGAVARDYVRVFETVAQSQDRSRRQATNAASINRPTVGVVLFTRGDAEGTRRALHNISETSEGVPVLVVDFAREGSVESFVRQEYSTVGYVRQPDIDPFEALAVAGALLDARYAKLMPDSQVLLPGWEEDLAAASRSGVAALTCAAFVRNSETGKSEVRGDVVSLGQLCVAREALRAVTAASPYAGGRRRQEQSGDGSLEPAAELLERLRESGYTVHHLNRAQVAQA